MHILLTDILTCPRCGPAFGLVILADRIDERRVIDGRLGCANCRETYPVEGSVADLRHPVAPPLAIEQGTARAGDDERAMRVAALLGAPIPRSALLVIEKTGEMAAAISGLLVEAHVIGASAEPPVDEPSQGMLSRAIIGERLPLRDRSLSGAALLGFLSGPVFDELIRTLKPGSRLVLDQAPQGSADAARRVGFQVHLEQGDVVVAAAPGRG
jgi:uncharacterized protein YbaR (Trm112 family)